MAAPLFSINLSNTGDLTIKHEISQAEISMTAAGEVTVRSTAGLGEIKMGVAGNIDVSAKTFIHIDALAGFEITGKNQALLQNLIQLISQYMIHTHPTGTGPSGPPITAPATSSGPFANINLMKG